MKHPVPPKGNARHIAHPESTRNPIRGATAKPSRRKLLCVGVGLAAAGTAPAVAVAAEVISAAPDPDARLVALCEEYAAPDRAMIANSAATADLLADDPGYDALFDEGVAMVPRLHELRSLIADTRPRTARGHVAKLEAARRSMLADADDPDSTPLGDRDGDLALAAIQDSLDLLRRGYA